MTMQEWKRIAERELLRYRDSKAYIEGFDAAGGAGDPAKRNERARWVWAIETVRLHLKAHCPEKEAFLTRLYGLDGEAARKINRLQLAEEWYISEATLYRWREELLLSVVLAAAQAGALRPF